MSCDSTVFVVTRLHDETLKIMVKILAVAQNFSFSTSIGLALGSTQPPIQWVPGACSLKAEQLGHEADHSHLHSAETNNAWTWAGTHFPTRLHGIPRKNLTLLLLLHLEQFGQYQTVNNKLGGMQY
jgi:hypothetical protein